MEKKIVLQWIICYVKRCLKRPFFIIAILLIPVCVFGLVHSNRNDQAAINVGIYTNQTSIKKQLEDTLLKQSDATIQYKIFDREQTMRKNVATKELTCGYILDDGLISVVGDQSNSYVKIVNELIYGAVYRQTAEDILKNFVKRKKKEKANIQRVVQLYQENIVNMPLFLFEYSDGTKNEDMNKGNTSMVALPVRGMVSVLVMFCAMIGLLFYRQDQEKLLFTWCRHGETQWIFYIYLIFPLLLGIIVGEIALFISNTSLGIVTETVSMLCFGVLIIGYLKFLHTYVVNQVALFCCYPVILLGSILLCPVFIDTSIIWGGTKWLQKGFPVSYYLMSVHTTSGKLLMIWVGITLLILALLKDGIKKIISHKM